MTDNTKECLSECLDSLLEAAEALQGLNNADEQSDLWYEKIQALYGQIEYRYYK